MTTFAATIDEWVREVPERQTAVFRGALQRFVSIAQTPVGAGGFMPVRDGFLRASVTANLTGLVPMATTKPADGVAYSYDPAEVALVINFAEVSDEVVIAWTANYARYAHWGARGHAGSPFLTLAGQQWPQLVEAEAAEVKAAAEGRG